MAQGLDPQGVLRDPARNVRITWVDSRRVSRWADGSAGFSGTFTVTADGYRDRLMLATWCHGLLVR